MLIREFTKELRGVREDVNRELKSVRDDLKDIREANEKKYVTQAEFAPWKWAITIIVGGILTAAIAALMASIIT